jgi:hypothetical protein
MKPKEIIGKKYQFSGKSINGYFDANFSVLEDLVNI